MTGGSSLYPAKATDRPGLTTVHHCHSWVLYRANSTNYYPLLLPTMPAGRPNRSYDIIIGSYGISNQVSSGPERERERTQFIQFLFINNFLDSPWLRWMVWEGRRGRSQLCKLHYNLRTPASSWLKTRQDNGSVGVPSSTPSLLIKCFSPSLSVCSGNSFSNKTNFSCSSFLWEKSS